MKLPIETEERVIATIAEWVKRGEAVDLSDVMPVLQMLATAKLWKKIKAALPKEKVQNDN